MLVTACWSWRCHRPTSKSETHNLPEYLSAVSGLQTLSISATQLSSPWNSLFKGQRQKGFVTLAHKSLNLLIYSQCRDVWQVVGSWAGWVHSKMNISVKRVLEVLVLNVICVIKKRMKRGERSRDKTRKWKGNDTATFLGLDLPADCCGLHFPFPGRHGGELWHGCPWGVGVTGDSARQYNMFKHINET